MAIEIPDTEPASVRAGDTVTWRKSLADYPATGGWVLYYRLINADRKIDITASADGAAHLVSVAKGTSAAYVAADYNLISWVDDGTDRVTLPQRSITVLPNLATLASHDGRSHAKKMLDAVEAALLSLATGERLAVVEAETAARRIKYDFEGLTKLRNLYAAEVNAEADAARRAAGLPARNKLLVKFR